MDERLEGLKKTYLEQLEDARDLYVYRLQLGLGWTDISRTEMKAGMATFLNEGDDGQCKFTGLAEVKDNPKTERISSEDLCVPKLGEYCNDVLMTVPKQIAEEEGGELAVYREFISFLSDLYVKSCLKMLGKDEKFMESLRWGNAAAEGETDILDHVKKKYPWMSQYLDNVNWQYDGTAKAVECDGGCNGEDIRRETDMDELYDGVERYAGCGELYGRYLMDPPNNPIFFACIVDPSKNDPNGDLNLICYGPFETETGAMVYCDSDICEELSGDAKPMTARYDPEDATMYMKHYKTDSGWVTCDSEEKESPCQE